VSAATIDAAQGVVQAAGSVITQYPGLAFRDEITTIGNAAQLQRLRKDSTKRPVCHAFLSLWLTIILSALTGAVSAILGGVVIEYAKPEIIKWSSKRTIKRHVNEEFTLNLSVIEAVLRVMRYAEGRPFPYRSEAILTAGEMLRKFRQDRYGHYFATDKDMLYELDVEQRLTDFYGWFGRRPVATGGSEFAEMLLWLDWVARLGKSYIEGSKLDYKPVRNVGEEVYFDLNKAEEAGRQ
jgi:hypothetical protein